MKSVLAHPRHTFRNLAARHDGPGPTAGDRRLRLLRRSVSLIPPPPPTGGKSSGLPLRPGQDSHSCSHVNRLSGLEADQKVIAAHGCYAMTATTALTAQNTLGVYDIHPVPPAFLRKQIDACFDDIGVDVVKTGVWETSPMN